MRRVVCLVLALVLVGTVCVASFGSSCDPATSQGTGILWRLYLQYRFAVQNAIHAALHFKAQAGRLFYVDPDLGVPDAIHDADAKADALLAEAQACFEKGDYRCAGGKALDAVYLYKQVITEMNALLGEY